MLLDMEVGLGPSDFVLDIRLDEDPAPLRLPRKEGGAPSQFSAHVYCGQTAGWIKMALGMQVGLGPGHIVLDGDTAPPPTKERSPTVYLFWPMAAWIKMPLGREVGLGPSDIVLDGDPAPPPPKGHSPLPIFGPYTLRPNGCINQDCTWYGGRLRPGATLC